MRLRAAAAAAVDNRTVIYLAAARRMGLAAIKCLAVIQTVSGRWRCSSILITSVRSSRLKAPILCDAASAAAALHSSLCSSCLLPSRNAVFF